MATRVAVLASGRGSNLRALHEYLSHEVRAREVKVALVLSDRADAGALAYAAENGIAAAALDAGTGESVGLAMHLKLIPSGVVRAYHGRIVNVHPALLPAFGGKGMYGRRVHEAVLASGARVTGVTVHFVDEQYDRGQIVAQWPVPVFADDSADSLGARVLRVEHLLLPRTVAAVARKEIVLGPDGKLTGRLRRTLGRAAYTVQPQDDDELALEIDAALAP